jgi:hypothetical protein
MCRAAIRSPGPIRPMPCSPCWTFRRRSGRRSGRVPTFSLGRSSYRDKAGVASGSFRVFAACS